jgi:hypothetical protein
MKDLIHTPACRDSQDAISVLMADDEEGEALFDAYDRIALAGSAADKSALAARICGQLTARARIEEQLFQATIAHAVSDRAVIDDAMAALIWAKALIRKVASLEPGGERHDAALALLEEWFRNHVGYMQTEVFPKLSGCGIDLYALGEELAARKLCEWRGPEAD